VEEADEEEENEEQSSNENEKANQKKPRAKKPAAKREKRPSEGTRKSSRVAKRSAHEDETPTNKNSKKAKK